VLLDDRIKADPALSADCLAEGEYVAFVPWDTLKSYLAPEGVRIFDGTRPMGDEDDRQRYL
jgi:hypothetical protein